MGWRWTKIKTVGPFRLIFTRSGLGGNFGIPGLRIGVSATGRRYISLGIPGTGLYWTHYFGRPPAETKSVTTPDPGPSQ